MRNVLMISAAFPPTGGPGVQRSVKFAKYLPVFGWKPMVWAAEPLDGLPVDETLLHDLPPEVLIHRQPFRRSRMAHPRLRRFMGWLPGLSVAAHGPRRSAAPGYLPDELFSWAEESTESAIQIIRKQRIDVVYSTFSPVSNHWLALKIQEATGLPWVADFRDLWTDDYRYRPRNAAQRAADRLLEQEILETADAIIGVSERQTSLLAGHVPDQRSKFSTITNGFDPDDFRGMHRTRDTEDRWVIAHVGRLDRWRACAAWFEGLHMFLTSNADARSRCALRIMGHAGSEVRSRLSETGAACEFLPYGPHRAAIQEMHDADLLLLLIPDGPHADSVIPAKLFEYLAVGTPILAVGPAGGECEAMVHRCRAGRAVGFHAPEVSGTLQILFEDWESDRTDVGDGNVDLQPYSRREQAGALAEILHHVAGAEAYSTRHFTIGNAASSGAANEFVETT